MEKLVKVIQFFKNKLQFSANYIIVYTNLELVIDYCLSFS